MEEEKEENVKRTYKRGKIIMDDYGYIFDKRKLKKLFIKYGLIMLTLFPILIVVNILLSKFFESGILFFDIMIGLVYIFAVEIILGKIKKRKEEKIERERIEEKRAKKRRKTEEMGASVVEISDVEVRDGKEKIDKKEDK